MNKTASSLDFSPSSNLAARILAAFDRFLMKSARLAERNGDVPYFGL